MAGVEQPTGLQLHYLSDSEGVWVTKRVGAWIFAYRIVEEADGRVAIAEARVLPSTPDQGHPASWSGEADDVPAGGLTARLLRSLQTRDVLTFVATEWERQRHDGPPDHRALLLEHGFVAAAEGAVRAGGRSDAFYADLARRYVGLTRSGTRNPIRALTAELNDQGIHFAEATVADLLRKARRDLGLLTEAPQGRSGGELTDKAMTLIDQVAANRTYRTKWRTWVRMRHPVTGGEARCTQLAFELVWAERGWQLVDPERKSS